MQAAFRCSIYRGKERRPSLTSDSPTVIVAVTDVLVAADLAAAVGEWSDASNVVIARGIEEGEAALEGVAGIFAAFLSGARARLCDHPLARAVRARGGHVIWIADPTEEDSPLADGWVRLDVPFTTPMVHEALEVVRRAGGHDGPPPSPR